MDNLEPDKNQPFSNKLKLILGILSIIALIVGAKFFNLQGVLKDSLELIANLGPWGAVAFILVYILATVLFIPGSLLTLGAGVLFGVVWGSIWVSIASTLGATCAFIVGRYLTRDWVSKQIESNEKFKAIDEAVAVEGWKIVGLTRLSPIFPFNLLNYAFGVTQVSLRDYFFASWIGMMPGTVMYVYIGSLAGNLAALGTQGRSRTIGEWVLYAVGLVAAIAVTVYITRIAKKALEDRIS
ncbi:TVP38/TMEM64 family protein [Kamptonema sp. UHCC 0994]|uniref:TVP38/TMEM64 family protein n=1 Tax=Kamptonema sp. UHCC 0994 TaxID=3031329 RepID=UPI0023B99F85|nr:TVP38/TMEM64 family protein [Kamptonema sp. UHCC 0994]MDF0553273.1 TVP38/TMEM64 family protein [Kamptonema sp. UHCC 0994]